MQSSKLKFIHLAALPWNVRCFKTVMLSIIKNNIFVAIMNYEIDEDYDKSGKILC